MIADPDETLRAQLAAQLRSLGCPIQLVEESDIPSVRARLTAAPEEIPPVPAADLVLIGLGNGKTEALAFIEWMKKSPAHRIVPVVAYGEALPVEAAYAAYGVHANCVLSFASLVAPAAKGFHPLHFLAPAHRASALTLKIGRCYLRNMSPFKDFPLGISGFAFSDLYNVARLKDLHAEFWKYAASVSPDTEGQFLALSHTKATPPLEGAVLIDVARIYGEFVAKLFNVTSYTSRIKQATLEVQPIFRLKTRFPAPALLQTFRHRDRGLGRGVQRDRRAREAHSVEQPADLEDRSGARFRGNGGFTRRGREKIKDGKYRSRGSSPPAEFMRAFSRADHRRKDRRVRVEEHRGLVRAELGRAHPPPRARGLGLVRPPAQARLRAFCATPKARTPIFRR